MMTVRFWGVRGSIAGGAPEIQGVGGNTSCVEVEAGGETLILDAGTGLRPLGAALARRGAPLRASLLLSHYHWDHIQGFPFFGPAYVPGAELAVYGPWPAGCSEMDRIDHIIDPERSIELPLEGARSVRQAFETLMRPPHFPVGLEAMRAQLSFTGVDPGRPFQVGAVTVRAASANHPNGCLAYRLDHGGASVVFATDTEHRPGEGVDASLLELSLGADLLIYDAQYTPAEYLAGKQGWGHSTAEEGIRLARAAGVGRLLLFHHDPSRDDDGVARIETETRRAFAASAAAREGDAWVVGAGAVRQAA